LPCPINSLFATGPIGFFHCFCRRIHAPIIIPDYSFESAKNTIAKLFCPLQDFSVLSVKGEGGMRRQRFVPLRTGTNRQGSIASEVMRPLLL
jgi:hypothetical protein